MDLHPYVEFLDDDTVAAAAVDFLYFISLPTKSVLSRELVEDELRSFTVLSDGRTALGGGKFRERGYCAIVTPPTWARDAVEEWGIYSNPLSAVARARAPIRAAQLAIQKHQLTLAEACKTAITSENCTRSLDAWCIAHNLLMEAVKSGEIPASRHLHDSIAHWHQVLYQHCSKLAMGEKCIGTVKLLFKEAEDAGVIAKGQIESLINTIGIRKDMDADNRFLVHATYQLFMRQAETDVRLRQVLHYQRVQQVTAVFNALIGCIPVGGAILTNVLSGGASVLKDMDVCGLVESVLGIGKEGCGVFVTDRLVDRVLQRSNIVLSAEEWKKVPAEKRKVVEDAASNIGLSIDKLREKLAIVAAMQASECGTPSTQVVVENIDEDAIIQPVIPIAGVSEGVASLSVDGASTNAAGFSAQSTASAGAANGCECELQRWEEEGVCKDVVGPLKRAELAACFAEFLVNYESDCGESYLKLKETVQEVFMKKLINGTTFAEADEVVKRELVEVLMAALSKVTDEDAMNIMEFLVKKYVRLASQKRYRDQ